MLKKKDSKFYFHDRQQFRTIAASSTKQEGETMQPFSIQLYKQLSNY